MNSDEALGRYQLYESGMVEMPEVWKAGIDPEAFGRKVREQDNGYFTDKGYVLLSGMNGSGKTYGETGQGGQTLRQGFFETGKERMCRP